MIFTEVVQSKPFNLELLLTDIGSDYDFTLDIINKGGGFFQAFLEESFKLFLTWRYGSVTCDPIFVLLPIDEDLFFEKKGCKRYALIALNFSCFEIVFILLIKIVTFYI